MRERSKVADDTPVQREPLAVPQVGREPLEELVLLGRGEAAIAAHEPIGGGLRAALGLGRFGFGAFHRAGLRSARRRSMKSVHFFVPMASCAATVRSEIASFSPITRCVSP